VLTIELATLYGMKEELAVLFSTQPGMANALEKTGRTGGVERKEKTGNINGLKQYICIYITIFL